MASEKPITENSTTRLKEAGIVASAFVGGALWITARLWSLESATDRVNYRLDNIEHLARDAASRADLRAFAEDLAEQNSGVIRVPKVR